jgi:hypothetical protein
MNLEIKKIIQMQTVSQLTPPLAKLSLILPPNHERLGYDNLNDDATKC